MRIGIYIVIALLLFSLVAKVLSADAGQRGETALVSSSNGKMPETVTLGSLAGRYEPVVFDHSGHVDMASGCGDCHHQHGSDRTLGCRECHSLDLSLFRRSVQVESFRGCTECHAGPSLQPNPARTGLVAAYHRACFRCHREVGSVGEDPKGCTEMCHARRVAIEIERE